MTKDTLPNTHAFLGRGWSFPPSFHPGGGDIDMTTDVENVQKCMHLLFATHPGERTMRHGYGCNLAQFAFTEITEGLITEVRDVIVDAISRYERRVIVNDIHVEPDEEEQGVLQVYLEYTISATNSRYNMVFPFYLNESQILDF